MLNRAISENYSPGSTFKLVTAAAALADGKDKNSQVTTAPGINVINGDTNCDTDDSTCLANYSRGSCGTGTHGVRAAELVQHGVRPARRPGRRGQAAGPGGQVRHRPDRPDDPDVGRGVVHRAARGRPVHDNREPAGAVPERHRPEGRAADRAGERGDRRDGRQQRRPDAPAAGAEGARPRPRRDLRLRPGRARRRHVAGQRGRVAGHDDQVGGAHRWRRQARRPDHRVEDRHRRDRRRPEERPAVRLVRGVRARRKPPDRRCRRGRKQGRGRDRRQAVRCRRAGRRSTPRSGGVEAC